MVKKDYLSKLNEYLNNQIPEVIFQLLKRTGYDTPIAIQTINFAVIKEVEDYVNSDNGKSIIDYLKSKNYPNTSPFALLPGHKALFIGLKTKSEQFDTFEAEDSNDIPIRKPQQQLDHQCVSDSGEIEPRVEHLGGQHSGNSKETNKEIENEIVSLLQKKIKKFVISKKIPVDNLENINLDIGNFINEKNKNKKNVIKCTVKCLLCEAKIPCIYASNWQISNYENHLKRHMVDPPGESPNLASDIPSIQQTDNTDKLKSIREPTHETITENSTKNATTNDETLHKRVSINHDAQLKINDVLSLDNLNISK